MGACSSQTSKVHEPSAKLVPVRGAVRILCLHGDGVNDKFMEYQMAPLKEALEKSLEKPSIPKLIRPVDYLPITDLGKPDRNAIKAMIDGP